MRKTIRRHYGTLALTVVVLSGIVGGTGCSSGDRLLGTEPAVERKPAAVELHERRPQRTLAPNTAPGLRASYMQAEQGDAGKEYRFVADRDGTSARTSNGVQRLLAELAGGALHVKPDGDRGDWVLSLRWTGIGRGHDIEPVATPEMSAVVVGNRASYRRNDGSEEWYLNGPRGIEQGFVVAEPPPSGTGEAVLSLAIHGPLTAVATDAGSQVEFRSATSSVVLHYAELVAWDTAGDQLAAWMTAGPDGIAVHVDDAGARYPIHVDPLMWVQDEEFVASDGVSDAIFAASIALSGDTVIVGAPNDYAPHPYQGSGYVFVRGGSSWSLQQKLSANDGANFDGLGRAAALNGDTVIVGAPTADHGVTTDSGAAYVFVRSGTTWSLQQKLEANSHWANDQVGSAVAVCGDWALVGVPRNYYGSGEVLAFLRTGGTWSLKEELQANDWQQGVWFGSAIAIEGDTAIVGSDEQGAAYIEVVNDGGLWGEQQKLLPSDAVAGDLFGESVALHADTAVVGAPNSDGPGGNSQGAAYVFVRSGTTWSEEQKLVVSDGAANDYFGEQVALDGDTILVGAYGYDGPAGSGQGAAYLFTRTNGVWSQQARLTAGDASADSFFGYSVALEGATAVVGAPDTNGPGGNFQGAAYVFLLRGTVGEACVESYQCSSGFCVDGVCCDSDCGGGDSSDCLACSIAAGAQSDGTCGSRADGLPCSDGLYCNGTEKCTGGTCGSSTGDPCAASIGNGDANCSEACNEQTQSCTAAEPDDTLCDDSDACTQTDTCQSGTCVGTDPITCSPPDECHVASCAPLTGVCSTSAKPDHTPCANGTCQTGVCVPSGTGGGGTGGGGTGGGAMGGTGGLGGSAGGVHTGGGGPGGAGTGNTPAPTGTNEESGGCGCRVVNKSSTSHGAGWLALGGLAAAFTRRRRRLTA